MPRKLALLSKAALVVAALVVATYWYMSPLVSIQIMRMAADEHDAQTFNSFVDYPRLRESLKSNFHAQMSEAFIPLVAEISNGSQGDGQFDMDKAIRALAGLALAEKLIDVTIQPDVVSRTLAETAQISETKEMKGGRIRDLSQLIIPASMKIKKIRSSASSSLPDPSANSPLFDELAPWIIERDGLDRVVAYALSDDGSQLLSGLVFDRSGFATWRLTGFNLGR